MSIINTMFCYVKKLAPILSAILFFVLIVACENLVKEDFSGTYEGSYSSGNYYGTVTLDISSSGSIDGYVRDTSGATTEIEGTLDGNSFNSSSPTNGTIQVKFEGSKDGNTISGTATVQNFIGTFSFKK